MRSKPDIRSLLQVRCSFMPHPVGFCLAVFLVFVLPARACSQNVGPGERRFNDAIYKGSHNSEVRNETLAQQIDSYNVWQIELDLMDYNGDFKSAGDACDPASLDAAPSLSTLLKNLQAQSDPRAHPFTIIYLDMKGNGSDGCLYSWGSQILTRLKTAFLTNLTAAAIYPSSVFINQDASSWPSYQNLASRGYRWAVMVDWHYKQPAGADQDEMFFEAETDTNLTSSATELTFSPNTVLINLAAGCDVDPTTTAPGIKNARWLYRAYPSGNCSLDCQLMQGPYWTNAISKGYNIVATNCINYSNTFDPPTQSPDPLYVSISPGTACPNGYSACEWGTPSFPFHNVGNALQRASPMATVLLGGGTYVVDKADQIIARPLKLSAQSAAILR